MAKKVFLTLLVMLVLASGLGAKSNPWGDLKKIYFYYSINDHDQVRQNLHQVTGDTLSRLERSELAQKLTEMGDRYFGRNNLSLAEEFYHHALTVSPAAWPVYNRLETINRRNGRFLISMKTVWRQLVLVLGSFANTFVLFNNLVSVLFFATLLLFFVYMVFLSWKYFKLATNDILMNDDNQFLPKKLLLTAFMLCWPILLLSGWGIYPFLIAGFLWTYLTHDEKKTTLGILIPLIFFSLLLAGNRFLEKSAASPQFQLVQNVFSGRLYPEETYRSFDDELKVFQAFGYYEHHQPDIALEILDTVKGHFRNPLKFNLLGSINYQAANLESSIRNFREALNLNEHDDTTLKNFALALLRKNDPKQFDSYAARYPKLVELKRGLEGLSPLVLSDRFLWRRCFNFAQPQFSFWNMTKIVVLEWLKIPLIFYILLMFLYIILLHRFFKFFGNSTYCTKCSRIIKKSSIEQQYILCDECYQLFLIKDPIFREAKAIKEREIKKALRLKYLVYLLVSLLVPGFFLNYRERSRLFIALVWPFFVLLGIFVVNSLTFAGFFSLKPIFLNLTGMAALILYGLANLLIFRGEDNGF